MEGNHLAMVFALENGLPEMVAISHPLPKTDPVVPSQLTFFGSRHSGRLPGSSVTSDSLSVHGCHRVSSVSPCHSERGSRRSPASRPQGPRTGPRSVWVEWSTLVVPVVLFGRPCRTCCIFVYVIAVIVSSLSFSVWRCHRACHLASSLMFVCVCLCLVLLSFFCQRCHCVLSGCL